jgi:hypothetical protein
MTQNNLGVALRALAGRRDGPRAPVYLEQSVAAFRSALQSENPRATAAGLGDDAE